MDVYNNWFYIINSIIFVIPGTYPFNSSYWALILFALGGFIATYISISNELKISVYLGILFALNYIPAILIHKNITFALIISALILSVVGGLIANQIRLRYEAGIGE